MQEEGCKQTQREWGARKVQWLCTRRVKVTGREETGAGRVRTGRYAVHRVWIEGTGQTAGAWVAHHLNGHQVKTPATELVTVPPLTVATKHILWSAWEWVMLVVNSAQTGKSPYSLPCHTLPPETRHPAAPMKHHLVSWALSLDALLCFILGYTYFLLVAVKIFSITLVILKLCYVYINWLDWTVHLYIYAGERSKNKEVVSKDCNEISNSYKYKEKGNVFLCPWQLDAASHPITASQRPSWDVDHEDTGHFFDTSVQPQHGWVPLLAAHECMQTSRALNPLLENSPDLLTDVVQVHCAAVNMSCIQWALQAAWPWLQCTRCVH